MEKNLNERCLVEGLNRAIQFIEESPEINIVGIRDALIKDVLNARMCDGIYADILTYVLDIDNAIADNRVNSFDNRTGALSRLRAIQSRYN